MTDGVDVPINLEGEQQLASPLSGQLVAEEFEVVQQDGAFRLRAPAVLSHEQLRSPLATPGKSPSTSANRSASIPGAADVSNSEAEEDPLPRRRPRREIVTAGAALKVASSAPSLSTPQELVDWCIAQAVSVTKLPFEQAPPSVSTQVAAFSSLFQEQVLFAICGLVHLFNSGQVSALYRNQHKLVAEISRVEGDGDALTLALAKDFPVGCSADVAAAASLAYEAARTAAVTAEDEEQKLKRLHSEYRTLCSLCAQLDAGLVSGSVVQDGSAFMQQVAT